MLSLAGQLCSYFKAKFFKIHRKAMPDSKKKSRSWNLTWLRKALIQHWLIFQSAPLSTMTAKVLQLSRATDIICPLGEALIIMTMLTSQQCMNLSHYLQVFHHCCLEIFTLRYIQYSSGTWTCMIESLPLLLMQPVHEVFNICIKYFSTWCEPLWK